MPAGDKDKMQGRFAGGREVRVFVSSTFRDMHAERDHLVTIVFPELRERVEQLGLEFFDVDLRWGVPDKDVNGETANSWEYCRQWIDRVEPFFVCILGQRYGWEPEPEQLKASEDSERQRAMRRSITDMEVRHAVLDTKLKRRSYFYFRASDAPVTVSEFVDPPPLLLKLAQLKTAVRSCGRPVRDYHCEWTGSGFIGMDGFGRDVLEDLWSGVLRDERYVSKQFWRDALEADPDTDPRYTDESRPVPPELWERVVTFAKPKPAEPLDAEREQMDAFAAARLRWFEGRTHELQQLTDFLQSTASDSSRLAVVAAVPGQGKSGLLARLSALIPQAKTVLITHFVGATERSAGTHALVERLLRELDRSGVPWPEERQGEELEPNRDFNSLCLQFAKRLGDYAGEREIVILIDALNQLSDGYDLQWLPSRLGPGVRVIVSCIEDPAAMTGGPEQRVLDALNLRQPAPLHVPLGPLTVDDVRTIVVSYLREYCHELDREHLDTLCAITQARNPLYLLVMLNELRTLGGNDLNRIVPARIASMAQDHADTVSLFRWMLQRLEEAFTPSAVQWWCLYLALGRVGMASQELADLLVYRLGAGAAAHALRIERGLRRYLQRRGHQLDFFHGQLRQAVLQQYGPQVEAATAHAQLADYFRQRADPNGDLRWELSPRFLSELPFHLARAEREKELHELFSQLAFLAARTATGLIFEQIADYALAGTPLPPDLEAWCSFLQKHAQRLAQYPAMLVALANHEGFPAAQAQANKIAWRQPWLRTSLEQLPVRGAVSTENLALKVTKTLNFHWGSASAIAHRKNIAFRFEQLGIVGVFDLATMRKTDASLSIQRDRPLVLACSPDAASVAIFFDTGMGRLYRSVFGQNDWPASLEPLAEFGFHLSDGEDPVAVWHKGAFWYQATIGSLAFISVERKEPFEGALPAGQHGELSALVFDGDMRLVAMQQGADSTLMMSGVPPVLRRAARVTAACACGENRIAVAFTDGTLVIFERGETLRVAAEVRAGMLQGSLGWDGARLLWMQETGGFMAWCPAEAAPRRVRDNQEIFRDSLHVIPREWFPQPDGSMLLGTTHSLVSFQLFTGGAAADGRLQEILGGTVWRTLLKRDDDHWLLEKQAAHATFLGLGKIGHLSCAVDGKGRFFALSSSGPGLTMNPRTLQSAPLRDCPPGVSAAVGEDSGGCWFTDRRGNIYFADATGRCLHTASVGLNDVFGSQIENCGSYLVWTGYSSKFFLETGQEAARTFVFFNKIRGLPPTLERMSEQFRHPGEGMCIAVCYDRASERLVTLWTIHAGEATYCIRAGPTNEFARWQFREVSVSGLGSIRFAQAGLSANGAFLAVINVAGDVSYVSVADGHVVATLAGSAPFTAIALGAGNSDCWLVESATRIYKCELIGDEA